jgi:transcriptional regulator with XRE-family HTH domain
MTLFDVLKSALRERDWTIPYFARMCAVSPQLAYKWLAEHESQRIIPGPKSCEKIAAALGFDPDYVLELAGHRKPRQPRADIDARRQVVRDQLDHWLAAVGPENEEYFWQHLKAQGDSAVDLIRRIGTAVNAEGEAAVNGAVSERAKRGRRRGNDLGGPLIPRKHPAERPLRGSHAAANERLAA